MRRGERFLSIATYAKIPNVAPAQLIDKSAVRKRVLPGSPSTSVQKVAEKSFCEVDG